MPRYANDGYIEAIWIESVADPEFVAMSEIATGVRLACLMTKDGLKTGFTESEVDDGALCEAYDRTLPGSYKTAVELTLKRETQPGDDPAWDLFATRGEEGTLVVRRGMPTADAFAAAQKVESYPSVTGIRRPADVATNEQAKFMLTLFGSSEPALDGLVVAS